MTELILWSLGVAIRKNIQVCDYNSIFIKNQKEVTTSELELIANNLNSHSNSDYCSKINAEYEAIKRDILSRTSNIANQSNINIALDSTSSHSNAYDNYDNVLNYISQNNDLQEQERNFIQQQQQQQSQQRLTSSYYDNLNSINFSNNGKSNIVPLYDNLIPDVNSNNVATYDNLENLQMDSSNINQRNSASINSLNQLDELNKSIIDQLCYVTDYGSSYDAGIHKSNDIDQDLSRIQSNLNKEVLNAQRQAEKLDKLDDMTITKVVQMNIPSKLSLIGDQKSASLDTDEELANLDESWQTLIKEVKDLSNAENRNTINNEFSLPSEQDESDSFFKADLSELNQFFIEGEKKVLTSSLDLKHIKPGTLKISFIYKRALDFNS